MKLIPKSKKYTIFLLSLLLICGVLLYWAPNLLLLHLIHKENPVPENLTHTKPVLRNLNHSISSKSDELSEHCINLKTPWNIKQKITNQYATIYFFHEKKSLQVIYSCQKERLIDSFLTGTPLENENLRTFFGEEHLSSDFNFTKLCLNTTPNQATIFTPKEALLKIVIFRMLRIIFPMDENIFELSTDNGIKGFQFGEAENENLVRVYLFDDKIQLTELVFGFSSQEEINFVLSSVKAN